jgi:hypothetical protein
VSLPEREADRPLGHLLIDAEETLLDAQAVLTPFLMAAKNELIRDFTPTPKMLQALLDAEQALHHLYVRLAPPQVG